ncbi:CubicO group peptidase (beta-lactamase class C family) [Pontibacter aydingkolensis]|uniref:Beta-lactamase family protein n=1 Tax=Pontibacter aydingkolensis TaxID=1911536 RepID=A0ABS7CNP2_9BACT|nr:serine hydrolase domain-containing protein [Pontibacter aydingkolensis]MBW7465448.1 beta-lactamase family protein [Pontibacter aydingkolensis]
MINKYSKSRHIIVFALYILFIHTGVVQAEPRLKQAIHRALIDQKLTGAVWAIVTPDGSIYAACAGFKNNEAKTHFQVTDKVQVGSITKTVLAAGILRLATEGKLYLDAPVNNYLPGVPFDNPWQETRPVTVRHLLDHTSGLGDLRLWHLFSTSSTATTKLAEFYLKDPSVLVIQAKPGSQFSYSNIGYTLLGMVIEAVTKQPYEAYLDEHLLKPLGMHNSTFGFVSQTGKLADTSLAMGHLDKGLPYAAYPMYIRPAGQFTTTAHDMGLFLRFMMSDGIINGKSFIDKAFLSQLGKAYQTDASRLGLPLGYALGASYRDRHGVIGLTHGGNIVGYRAMMYMFPKEQKAFFIAHNMDSETADYHIFNKLLIEHLDIAAQSPPIAKESTADLADWNGYYVPAITKVVPFGLADYLSSFTKVEVTPQGASFSPFQKEPVILHYLGNHTFIAEGKSAPSHAFYKDADGQQFITTGLSTIRKTNGLYILLGWLSIAAGLAGIIFLLFSWLYKLITLRKESWRHPLVWHFIAVAIILSAMLFLLNQSFVSLGDKTSGSVLLATGTFLLPALTAVSTYKFLRSDLSTLVAKVDLLALVFVLQLTVVLFLNGLIPLMLWK